MIKDYIPEFLKEYRRKYLIKKKFSGNMILTTSINMSATLGKNVYLARNVDIRKNVSIGDNSYCSPGTVVFNGCSIGSFCSIGYNVQIGCPEHPINFFSTSPRIYRNPKIKKYCCWPEDDFINPVVIENDVWIGSNAVILQGVTIGTGAIIAAGAVVTKNVPSFSIWGGTS